MAKGAGKLTSVARAPIGTDDIRAVAKPAWPMWCVLALVVASDFKFRLRANDQAVSGNADPFVLLEIALYAAVACFLFVKFRPAVRTRRADLLTWLAYAYAIVLAGSALYSPYFQLALVRAAQVFIVLALARSIARHCDEGAPHRIAHGYAVLMALSVCFGFVVRFPQLPTQKGRFTWLYVHPVQAGAMLAVATVLMAGYAITTGLDRAGPRWRLPVYAALFAVCAAGLVATKTRGAVLGAIVGVLVLVWTRWRGQRKVEVGVVGAVALIAVALTTSSAIEDFFARGESAARLASLNSRTNLWGFAFERFAEHPLYGFGLTSSRGLFLEQIGLGGGHNALVNLLVDTGLLGALAWIALLGCMLLAAHRLRRHGAPSADRTILLALMFALLADSVFVEGLGAPANVLCTWLFVLVAWISLARKATT